MISISAWAGDQNYTKVVTCNLNSQCYVWDNESGYCNRRNPSWNSLKFETLTFRHVYVRSGSRTHNSTIGPLLYSTI